MHLGLGRRHTDCHLRCLASVVSDHSPLWLDCSPTCTVRRRFHFEDFWLRLPGFHDTVATAWGSVHDPDPFRRLMMRLQATARMLTSWSAKSTGCIRDKMTISHELISRFDKAQEDRVLSPPEDWLRKQLKIAYLGLASLERTIARQRARITTLKDGDANTAFFHRQCSYRRQKNHIHALTANGHVTTGRRRWRGQRSPTSTNSSAVLPQATARWTLITSLSLATWQALTSRSAQRKYGTPSNS
uniref:Uncharacterized protein n=1 Tax=Aegilops tauschii subsp. strangulata TaxID=200361 RepID=A0A453NMC7_AEGTS